jgi:hypothetical protein
VLVFALALATAPDVGPVPIQSGVAGLPDWAPLLIAPVGAAGFLVYWYLFLRDD